jgi:hypothetical protein
VSRRDVLKRHAGWLLLAAACAWAGPLRAHECRIAMDLGSSGVRAAASGPGATPQLPRRDIDLLAPLWAGQFLDPQLPAIEAALAELPREAGWPARCARVGGGFSAWRLAWRQDGPRLAQQLETLRERTGVAVLVLPAQVEGRYGYQSAQQALGPRLATSHILDIGGGSLQVASQERAFGLELGQKSWHRLLCQSLGRGEALPCALQPLAPDELRQARARADEQVRDLPAEVGTGTLTAISRPVTRGIRPALVALGADTARGIRAQDLGAAIDRLAGLDPAEAARASRSPPAFAGFLLSDMLLVEGVMRAMASPVLSLAETQVNNLPALLRDDRAFDWARQHGCYLQRLRQDGPAAYFSDPASCPTP